jgi:phage I-like protein
VPDWSEPIPSGSTVSGRDRRTWLWDDIAHQLVLTAFTNRPIDMVIDWEHATEIEAQ